MTFSIARNKTRKIAVGSIQIGGNAPISVQSMTNTKTHDVAATVHQIHRLEEVGCEIIRVAIPDEKAAESSTPSSFAIFFSTVLTVGLLYLAYM